MSFGRGPTFGSSTPLQPPPTRPLYPSLNPQTPATPTPSNSQPLQQKPPPRPASVPLSFGGGLSHSASTPSLTQSFQNGDASQANQQSSFGSQPFSPAPQPPLTTYDLGGNPVFSKASPVPWGGQQYGGLGGHGLVRSHSQQFPPPPIGTPPLGERRYLPSHLRSYSPERSSPLAKGEVARDPSASPRDKRRVSFGSVTTFGHPSNFGGSGFGTPKDDPKSKSKREEDDLPPSASIYDFSRSSTFSNQEAQKSPSPPPDIVPSLFSSAPPSSPPKRQDPTPVIIFGFPPSHSLLIIHEYEKYGPILEHFSSTHMSPSSQPPSPEILHGGNWIRITYADPVSAARAVATNGQLVGGAYMIGVVYAPKPPGESTTTSPPPANEDVERRQENNASNTSSSGRASSSAGGERKMNVVKGGQSMFVKKEAPKENQVPWTAWIYNSVFGEQKQAGGNAVGGGSSVGGVVLGGQSNVVVKALKGLSETVFGF